MYLSCALGTVYIQWNPSLGHFRDYVSAEKRSVLIREVSLYFRGGEEVV